MKSCSVKFSAVWIGKIWTCWVFLFGVITTCLAAEPSISSTTAETINLGVYSTSNWRSDDFKGTAYRQWDKSGSSFCFDWNTEKGDQIGRIGVSYGSPYLGVKLDDLKPECVMSTHATYTSTTKHWFYWAIYGWTHRDYTYWGNTPNGWDNEFYVVFYTDMKKANILSQPGCVEVGSVTVDGVVFDCYHTPRAHQSQWLAVCRSNTWNAAVDLKKIIAYWRSKGLGNEYVVDLGWALEGFSPSIGKVQLTDISIPNLNAPHP